MLLWVMNIKNIHLKIGRLLLQKFTKEEREERIFDIVNHLNSGIDLIVSQAEKTQLAELNLRQEGRLKPLLPMKLLFNISIQD